MDFRGPVTTLNYEPNAARCLGMIAGGTGITPMYQIIRTVLSNPVRGYQKLIPLQPRAIALSHYFHRRCLCMRDALTVWRCRSFPKQEDKTKLKLLYANRTPADTVLLSELRELQHSHPEQLEVRYLVEQLEGARQHDVSLAGSSVRTEADFAVGRPCAEAIRGFLPSPFEAQTAVLVCGPEGMMDALCGVGVNRLQGGEVPRLGGLLRSMGYGRQVVQFSDTSVA